MTIKSVQGEVKSYEGKSGLRVLMVVLVGAAIYGAGLYATSFLPTIPGVTWLRPGNALSEILAVSFGVWGSLAVMLGNTLGDFLRGNFNPAMLWWLLPLEFFCTAHVVYLGVRNPSLKGWRDVIEWALYAVVAQGLLTGFGIAFFICYVVKTVPVAAFTSIGWTISLNEGIPAIGAFFLHKHLVYPWLVKRGLWWGRKPKED